MPCCMRAQLIRVMMMDVDEAEDKDEALLQYELQLHDLGLMAAQVSGAAEASPESYP